MKILTLSDTHGDLPRPPKGDFDVFMHAGDICPNWHLNWRDDGPEQMFWIQNTFCPWLRQINAKHKLCVMGNHDSDVYVKHIKDILQDEAEATLLHDEVATIDGKKFYGHPWTLVPKGFPVDAWNFAATSEDTMALACKLIPDDTEVLLTHSPPHGILDATFGRLIGSQALLDRVKALPNLRLHVYGHCHESRGRGRRDECIHVNSAARWHEINL